MTGDGSYGLPALAPSAGGYYAWRVTVDGTATSLPATACGAVTKVRARTTTTVIGIKATAHKDDYVQVQVTVSGLPFPDSIQGTLTLFGPYASEAAALADHCGTNAGGPVAFSRSQGNGTFDSPSIQIPGVGPYYAWGATISSGDLWVGSSSPCAAPGTLLAVL